MEKAENVTKNNLEQMFSFVQDILNAPSSENKHILQFAELVKKDFTEFCDSVSGLNQMKDVNSFEKILSEMRLIANCPPLHSKMVGAIGGGYSSGKSTFINSLMDEEDETVKLAEGIRPVTAIPSYVICGKEQIQGVSYRGGKFNIENEMYKNISHETLKSLKFDLKQILQYIMVCASFDSELFENICLIDTPGYNAPKSGTTEHDEEISNQYIKDAKFLVWLVGLDSNGTLSSSDISFLEELPFGKEDGRSLYVVVNKADSVTPSNREKILNEIKDVLDNSDFKYEGISLYSSKKKKEFAFDTKSIIDFLKSQNIHTKKYVELALPLKNLFDRYEQYAKEKNSKEKEYQKKVQNLILDGLESNAISITSSLENNLEEGLYELKKYFKPDDLDSTIKRIEELRSKFFKCLDDFCAEMGIEKIELPKRLMPSVGQQNAGISADGQKNAVQSAVHKKKFCDKCGTKLNENYDFCPKCGTETELK